MMASIGSSILILVSEIASGRMLKGVVQGCNSLCLDGRTYCAIVREHSGYLGGRGLSKSKLKSA